MIARATAIIVNEIFQSTRSEFERLTATARDVLDILKSKTCYTEYVMFRRKVYAKNLKDIATESK